MNSFFALLSDSVAQRRARCIFSILYVLLCFAGLFFSEALPATLRRLVFLFGAVLIAWCFLFEKRLKPIDRFLPIVLTIWYFISQSYKYKAPFLTTALDTLPVAFSICLAYWHGCLTDSVSAKKELRPLLGLFATLITLACLLSLTNVLFHYLPSEGPLARFGLSQGRLRIHFHPNGSAFFCLIAATLSLYLALTLRSVPLKAVFIIELFILAVTLALTDSRNCRVVFCLGAGLFLFAKLCPPGTRTFQKRMLSVVLSFLGAILIYSMLIFVTRVFPHLVSPAAPAVTASVQENIENPAPAIEETIAPVAEETVSPRPIGDTSTVSSRLVLWRYWLGLLKDTKPSPLYLGTARIPENMPEANYPPHNTFLTLLVRFGLPSLILVAALLVCLVLPCLRLYRRKSNAEALFPITVLIALVYGLFEDNLFYSQGFDNFILLLIAGLCVGLDPINAGAVPSNPAKVENLKEEVSILSKKNG